MHILFTISVPAAPENVRLRMVSDTTAIEVRWDESKYASHIAGYRVYYNMFAIPEMDKWQSVEIGPYTMTVINGIEPHTVYAVKVRAKSVDGRYGNFSDVVTTNVLVRSEYFMFSIYYLRSPYFNLFMNISGSIS